MSTVTVHTNEPATVEVTVKPILPVNVAFLLAGRGWEGDR